MQRVAGAGMAGGTPTEARALIDGPTTIFRVQGEWGTPTEARPPLGSAGKIWGC